MASKKAFILAHEIARQRAMECVRCAPDGFAVVVQERNRSLEQNAAQWPILEAFAEQLTWPVNGQMVKLSADNWKDILTAAFKQENPKVAMGLNGGMVMLGQRTREMGKREFSDWLEFLHAVAADRGVNVYVEAA